MQRKKYQLGQSAVQMLILVSVGGFFLTCILKLGPSYYDNFVVSRVLNSLEQDADVLGRDSNRQIKMFISQTISANNLRGAAAGSILVKRNSNKIIVTANYEERIPLMGNIDVVLTFNNAINIDIVKR